jgi:uncharacterized membrane protein YfcA
MIEMILASLALGAVAGLAAGLLGIGGGAIIVPALSILFTLHGFAADSIMIMAVATSLASAIVTSLASVLAHQRLGNVIWPRVLRFVPGLLLGASGGALVADQLNSDWLRYGFAGYLLVISWQMARTSPSHTSPPPPLPLAWDYPVSLVIGVLSALLGIGGGTLTVPYLLRGQLLMKQAVASSSACAVAIALSAASSYALLGAAQPQLPAGSWGYLYLPALGGIVLSSIFTAPIGAQLSNRLPAQHIKRYFAAVLVVMAAKMLWP